MTSKARAVAVIIGRAGSKGLPGKNAMSLHGRPIIHYSIEAARAADSIDDVIVSTDGEEIARAAEAMDITVIRRPVSLATDTATVDAPVRHALEVSGVAHEVIVILYANVPVRPPGLIDRAVSMLVESGADSVQSYAVVGKHHPYWMVKLDDESRVEPYAPNTIYRRQDLPRLYLPDGGVIAVTRESLFTVVEGQPHAFLGPDRRGIITEAGAVVDVDAPIDLKLAEIFDCVAPDEGGGASMKIGSRDIGPHQPPYVIAEIGVNHDGSPECAMEMVDLAHGAGADAIKLQLFETDRLLSKAAKLAAYQERSGASDPFAMLRALELSVERMSGIVARAHEAGLHAIVSIFSVELVESAETAPFDAYKTASPDIINRPLIQAMMNTGKPLILSTGAATLEEVAAASAWLGDHPHLLMHCVSSYPTPDRDAALAGREAMLAVDPHALGYSDHTSSVDTGALAVAGGACLLEKHLTYDRSATGPDHAASLDPQSFAEYVGLAQRAWTMRGPLSKAPSAIELDVRSASRQSLTTRRDLPAGHTLGSEDLTIKRPGSGVSPARLEQIVGRRLSRPIEADMPLTEAHLA